MLAGITTVAAHSGEVSNSKHGTTLHRTARPAVYHHQQRRSDSKSCNGYGELCSKRFNEVAYATTHNSYAYGDNIAANQNKDIRQQLDDGIRGFMLDLYKLGSGTSNEPYLCHTSCTLLNGGKLVDALKDFKTFLDANKGEIVTIFIENGQPFSAAEMAKAFTDAGLEDYAFSPSDASSSRNSTDGSSGNDGFEWPSLADMIDAGKRLVVFTDSKADAAVPWILNEGSYAVQTSFAVEEGSTFDCNPLKQIQTLWVMNHFVFTNYTVLGFNFERPAPNSAGTVNTLNSIVDQSKLCSSAGHFANFVTVDYYDVGDAFKAVAKINGVDYKSTAVDTFPNDSKDDATSAAAISSTAVLLPAAVTVLFSAGSAFLW
ncbi:PLC-like phosphodiesterase [Coemansia reversa NRRL 1564]|uniref:PLC-like phosphodiesterase n=1 Tax=Coemansia reversa (strain ATCC 12441 / NRRL 1564) TaxID=763665 RepID=A0A2G5B7Y1_COERN|nr:PLC-like phosphodiesterase [Coemansia reversa NRRL 1564]|eukprot:PIA15092.1 PLC-like phosphodiesterase [Coemansia reversa NRRL 1564]